MRAWILTVVVCAGCAMQPLSPLPRWHKPDASDADARAALTQCRGRAAQEPLTTKLPQAPDSNNPDAQGLSGYGVSMEDMGNYRRAINECMAAEGWSRQ